MKWGRTGKFSLWCGLLLHGLTLVSAASAATLNVSVVVLSKGYCFFTNNSAELNFGNLNPLAAQDVTVDTGNQLSFFCIGNGNKDITFSVTAASSQYGTAAAPRMYNASASAFLPYELSLAPASGSTPKKKGWVSPVVPLVVYGTVRANSYRLAPFGAYEDTATIQINP